MNKLIYLLAVVLMIVSCNPREILHRPESNDIVKTEMFNFQMSNMKSFHDFKMRSIDGAEIDFSQYKGKKVVLLNVASECGYTPQYAKWEAFYKENKDKIVVLGFPCNQFGGQESGSHEQIKSFCQKNYGVTFPIFEKVEVKGGNKTPLYAWLTNKTENGWCDKEPSWNFCKYLVNEKGELLDFFASGIEPDNVDFQKSIAR
jgi:glutathione peroxidase